jgi:hypothetical protein
MVLKIFNSVPYAPDYEGVVGYVLRLDSSRHKSRYNNIAVYISSLRSEYVYLKAFTFVNIWMLKRPKYRWFLTYKVST